MSEAAKAPVPWPLVVAGVSAVLVGSLLYRRHRRALALSTALAKRIQADEVSLLAAIRALPTQSVLRNENAVYSHGGFMGAATECFRHDAWAQAVKCLTPAYYRSVLEAAAAQGSRLHSGAVMQCMENNPVMAAFGTSQLLREARTAGGARGSEGAGAAADGADERDAYASPAHNPVVIEWDVYLCPDTYKELGQAPGVIASDAMARRVVEQCVVAHGSIQHTIMERMFGVDMYSRIAARPIATTVPEWLRCYSAAHASAGAAEGCPLPAAPAAAPRLCVFLDVKSTRAPAAALRALIRGLNLYGIAVWGAGSFVHHQLKGIGEVEQEVHAVGSASSVVRLPPALPLHIYTSAGEIQRSVLSGKLPRGASVLFNGSSLLKSKLHPSDAAATQASYVIDEPVVAELCALAAAHDLHLGYYTQEVVLDTVAYSLLVKIAHAYRGTFDLGFNYSNLPGVAAADIKPSAAMATTGLVIPAIWRPLVYKAWTLSAPAK